MLRTSLVIGIPSMAGVEAHLWRPPSICKQQKAGHAQLVGWQPGFWPDHVPWMVGRTLVSVMVFGAAETFLVGWE